VVAILGALGTLGLDLSRIVRLPRLVVVGLTLFGGSVAITALLVKQRNERQQRRRAWEAELALPPLKSGRLRTVSEVNPYDIGVSPSKYTEGAERPPYVRRDLDVALDDALATKPFVVIVGDSKVGKSRTAYEAALRAHPGRALIVPGSEPGTLTRLFHEESDSKFVRWPSLLWLDDLDRYLGVGGLDLALLDRLTRHEPPVTVLATITSLHAEIGEAAGGAARGMRHVLDRAHELRLASKLSEAEIAKAAELYPGEDFTAGIGEELVAARVLVRKYENGREATPFGRAIVDAAIDMRRAGILRPIAEEELRELYTHYLHELRVDQDANDEAFRLGIAWARRPIASHVALLSRTRSDSIPSYEVFDFIVEYVSGRHGARPRAVPSATWRFLIDTCTDEELARVGLFAYLRHRLPHVAREALTRAAASDTQLASWSAFGLGQALRELDDFEGAKRALEQASASTDATLVASAALELGSLLLEHGDMESAKQALERAGASSEPDLASAAARDLGVVLVELGDEEGARRAFEQAAGAEDTTVAAQARFNLGLLLENRGDIEGAKRVYKQLITFGDSDRASKAALNLGALRARQGNVEGAWEAYKKAAALGDADIAPIAAVNLGLLLAEQGEVEGSRHAYEQAIATGHPEQAPRAMIALGLLLKGQRDTQGARQAFERAMNSEHADSRARATLNLGILLAEQADVEGARQAYEQAVVSGHPEVAPIAMFNLGLLLAGQGDVQGAQQAYEQAIATSHPDQAPTAAVNLGALLDQHGDIAGARQAYERAIASGHPDMAPKAAVNLGLLLGDSDVEAAKEAYVFARSSAHAFEAAWGAFGLGILLQDQGDVEGARQAYDQAIASGDPFVASAAAVNLGELLVKRGDTRRAQELLEHALASEDEDIAPMAAVNLGALLEAEGDLRGARRAYQRAIASGNAEALGEARRNLQGLTERYPVAHPRRWSLVHLRNLRRGPGESGD
jgi:tetratricopeptide (TPR) repeat protein/transcriptional regulator with XRE-family HTH domain